MGSFNWNGTGYIFCLRQKDIFRAGDEDVGGSVVVDAGVAVDEDVVVVDSVVVHRKGITRPQERTS